MDKVDTSASSFFNPALLQNLKQGATAPGSKKTKGKGESRTTGQSPFSEMLENSWALYDLGPLRELPPSEEALTELTDALRSAGSDLKERPFADEILAYKKAVRNFIHHVLEYGYETEKTHGIKKKIIVRGEAKWNEMAYHQVRVVDRKLEELAAAILSGQASVLERVSKIDEITGLLVDLTITGTIKER